MNYISVVIFFQMLLDAGADPNIETPGCGSGGAVPGSPPPPPACAPWGGAAGWTALVYACARGSTPVAAILLARGARVEGAATHHEDRTTLTPLQVYLVSFILKMIDFV